MKKPPIETSPLTDRETEALRLLTEGLTCPQIAERMSISKNTAGNHLRHIYKKLGVGSKATATAIAIRKKWV